MEATRTKNDLIRRFHAVCKANGKKDYEVEELLNSFNVTSSKHLSEEQLLKAIAIVDKSDMWRKRVIAVIGAYLRGLNREENMDTIKAIALRACSCKDFNRIPISKLRALYYEFKNKNYVAEGVRMIKQDHIHDLEHLN